MTITIDVVERGPRYGLSAVGTRLRDAKLLLIEEWKAHGVDGKWVLE